MPNSYFQFKQFLVEQGQTAMKVTTEACAFGAWIVQQELQPRRILDIGTGTGLLSLMLAQYYTCPIDGVEIDEAAAKQAASNFEVSPWSDRLHIIHTDIQSFASITAQKYDLIISNPPFFATHHLSDHSGRNKALHQGLLTQKELLASVKALLSEKGKFAVIYPLFEASQFLSFAETVKLKLSSQLFLKDKESKPALRQFQMLQNGEDASNEPTELVIKNESGDYTDTFVDWLKPYYLHL